MKLLCVMIGYLCGCFLTAQLVARRKTGKSVFEAGSGNPGTANIGGLLGIKWAAVTLLGDILKTVLPCMICRYTLFPSLGRNAILYTGLGTALGHGFPFWNRFRGGKSVAVTCAYMILFSPLWGIAAELIGLGTVIATGYLALGAVVIPVLYLVPVFRFYGPEVGCIALAGAALLVFLHCGSLRRIVHKTENKIDLLAKFKNR